MTKVTHLFALKISLLFFVISTLFACVEEEPIFASQPNFNEKKDSTQVNTDDSPNDNEEYFGSDSISYLALGDSYTIGQSVSYDERWPVQLADRLIKLGFKMKTPEIIARTGWTTSNLKNAIVQSDLDTTTFDFVSLLIGVNNQYQGRSISAYTVEFEELLQTAIRLCGGHKDRVFVLSIPDYGYTPFGQANQAHISAQLDEYNRINEVITAQYEVQYFNITDISRQAGNNPSLVAGDGLHPSGEMYRQWVVTVLSWFEEQVEALFE